MDRLKTIWIGIKVFFQALREGYRIGKRYGQELRRIENDVEISLQTKEEKEGDYKVWITQEGTTVVNAEIRDPFSGIPSSPDNFLLEPPTKSH